MRVLQYLSNALLMAASLVAATAAMAQGITVVITDADCRDLVAHQPGADVTYQAGKDVYGRDVAAADINGGLQLAIPESLRIPIEIDLFERFGIPANAANFEADAQVGEVVVKEGRSYFNGQPLQNEEQARLAAACQRVLRGTND